MRILSRTIAALFLVSAIVHAKEPPTPSSADLLLREIRYNATLADAEARFVADIDLESLNRAEGSLPLFEGEVAFLTMKHPPGLRIVREGSQYRIVASKQGRYKFQLELVAKLTRVEPWNQVSFTGPAAAIASVTAQAGGTSVDLQLLSGTTQQTEQKDGTTRIRGFLGADRVVSLRWQSKAAEAARRAVVTGDTIVSAQVTPSVIKFTTQLKYDIVQGALARLTVGLPSGQTLTRLQGD